MVATPFASPTLWASNYLCKFLWKMMQNGIAAAPAAGLCFVASFKTRQKESPPSIRRSRFFSISPFQYKLCKGILQSPVLKFHPLQFTMKTQASQRALPSAYTRDANEMDLSRAMFYFFCLLPHVVH